MIEITAEIRALIDKSRRRSYLLTEAGQTALAEERRRLQAQIDDYDHLTAKGGT